ncbi:ATPase [Prolixibacter bellariivorans]|uniref:ATPase n=1 Tax=Prolixibacter bellariivorans TaxID=314319 RepID=A0A5M4B0Q2_9BACT|nr:AAA family ATPase [Prolixibacter bellariivorans]GET33413.1 ATPase [Prolixibacter bellariivorans]
MVYVLTGGPGFGKTALAEKLALKGYQIGPEIARVLIDEQLKKGGEILPWRNSREFERRVMESRIRFIQQIPDKEIAFADRGLPDQVAFSLYKGKPVSEPLAAAVKNHRYAETVFITPPWREIYTEDDIRKETFEEACRIHDWIVKAYREAGYHLVEIPKGSVDERVKFIADFVSSAI